MKAQRYFIGQDQDGHHYLIPVEKRTAWESWNELDQTTDGAWNVPKFAKAINRHPSFVTFTDPKEDV